jgi:hypothetical protein
MAAMAKKKTQSKKHKFKYAESGGSVVGSPHTEAMVHDHTSEAVSPRPDRAASIVSAGRDFSYVGADLRRIMVMAAFLIALEVALWGLLGHTGLGNSVYQLVKV